MPHSFTLSSREKALITFHFSAAWHNKIEIRGPLGNHDRDNFNQAGGSAPIELYNEGATPAVVNVRHIFKRGSTGHQTWIETELGSRVEIGTLKDREVNIRMGFKDQETNDFNNVIISIKISRISG